MSPKEERAYERGEAAAWTRMLKLVATEMQPLVGEKLQEPLQVTRLLADRAQVVEAL